MVVEGCPNNFCMRLGLAEVGGMGSAWAWLKALILVMICSRMSSGSAFFPAIRFHLLCWMSLILPDGLYFSRYRGNGGVSGRVNCRVKLAGRYGNCLLS